MKILIPMSGQGKRFLRADYKIPKTLLEAEGMPVVEHVVRRFSPRDHFVFGVNEEHLARTNLSAVLERIAPQKTLVSMPYPEGGVIATLTKMLENVSGDEPVIVNYCDFSWVWDYEDFKKKVSESGCDGAVVCYRGFHPHLLGPNLYATLDTEGPWMKEIREKHSWHPDKREDWTSSGTYYFKSVLDLKHYCRKILERPELRINGEYYVSQLYQLMKEDGRNILIYEIPFMLQWGTPEDFQEYLHWSDYFRIKSAPSPPSGLFPMNVLILMAGAGQRFSEAGYREPKPFIPVAGKPMAAAAAGSLPRGLKTFFVSRSQLREDEGEKTILSCFPGSEVIRLDRLTDGQASTAFLAADCVPPGQPLLIGACDHEIFYDPDLFARMTSEDSGCDALIFTFRNHPAVRRNPAIYGWVDADASGRVLGVSCKIPPAGDPAAHHAVTGSFWFREARMFSSAVREMVAENARIRNEFYIDHAMNFFLRRHPGLRVFEVKAYASWGTPDDLRTYQYWEAFFRQAPFHPFGKSSL